MNWPDAVPVEILLQPTQDNDHDITTLPTQHETNYSEIPPLETDIDEEEEEGQFEDIQTYLDHHNIYQESQNIRKEYTKRLLDLDDDRYYRDIDRIYETYRPCISYSNPRTTLHDARAHTSIRQRNGTSPQRRTSWALTLWSL